MSIQQGRRVSMQQGFLFLSRLGVGLLLGLIQITSTLADELVLQAIDVVTLPGDKLQIQLQMDGNAVTPRVFQTDNPARIAMDFNLLKNGLNKKIVPINAGPASDINIVEAPGRTRLVVNLLQAVPYKTEVKGNQVLLTLMAKMAKATTQQFNQASAEYPSVSRLLPKQGIASMDFKRGDKGEGRIILGLSNANTVVDTKETAGKVVVNFMNTALPPDMTKRLDVSDFATPVKYIELQARGPNSVMSITPVDGNYEYSSFQEDGYLTVEFRPLTPAEKMAQEKEKFPYVGEKLSLNFQDIEIRSVLQILADFTKLNVVASDNVTGKVTLQMNDVPWDQALDLILKSKGLSKRQNGDVILVAPTSDINKIESDELEAKKVVEQLEPLKTEYIQINYAKAENFRSLIMGLSTGSFDGCTISKTTTQGSSSQSAMGGMQGGQNAQSMGGMQGFGGAQGGQQGAGMNSQMENYRLLSRRGSAVVDGRTNTLIVKDTGDKIAEIRKLIELLDKPVRQVVIESRIAIASNNFARTLGVRFGAAKAANIGGGKTFGIGGGGTSSNIGGGMDVNNNLVDLGATALASGTPLGALGMTLARGADYVLNLELQALQDSGTGEVLSNPRVMTSDRCKAIIKQGVQIPYVVTSANSGGGTVSNTNFKDAYLMLDVTPQITPSGSITMNLNITKDQVGDATSNGVAINSRELTTTVTVNDGETVVLGGVFESELNNTTSKIPFFADLPGIGFLFTKKYKTDDKRELLIFVTPKVVNNSVMPK